MPFVKLDCGVLESSLWPDRDLRDVFLTALCMAKPIELLEPRPQLRADSLEETGWSVPAGWYGMVHAAGVGILVRAGVEREVGLEKLRQLGEPDPDSRSQAFDGRRLVRVDGGYIVLNYQDYRDRDYTAAERSKRWRERKLSRTQHAALRDERDVTRNVTQAEAEAEAEREERQKAPAAPESVRRPEGVPEEHWRDWLAARKAKHLKLTPTAFSKFCREVAKAGMALPEAIRLCAENGWAGFNKDWLRPGAAPGKPQKPIEHMRNMPLGTAGCSCAECVSYRQKHAGGVA